MDTICAAIACLVLIGLALFQLALILGKPYGRFAWGGQHDKLPKKLRIGSIVSIVLYAIFIVLLLNALTADATDSLSNTLLWIIFAYFVTGIFLNALSRSTSERLVMTPIAFTLAVCTFILAA